MTTNTDIAQLKFNKMSSAKYEELKEAGQLVDTEFYITPDTKEVINLIGQFVQLSCSADYIPDGCLPCDGSEYSKDMFQMFWTKYLVTEKLNTCTYEEYASEISTFGQCIKFAIDTVNNKFKTPLIKDGSYLTQALSDSELGKVYNESLPNIRGGFKVWGSNSNIDGTFGAFYLTNVGESVLKISTTNGIQDGAGIGNLDASRSSSTYQDNAKVQGDNARARFFVVVANSYQDTSVVDWSAYITALNNKANIDLSNVLENIDYVIERGQSEDGSQWYRKWKSGWLEQGGQQLGNGATVTFLNSFKDNTYIITSSVVNSDDANKLCSAYKVSATQFKIHSSDNAFQVSWYACGQGE